MPVEICVFLQGMIWDPPTWLYRSTLSQTTVRSRNKKVLEYKALESFGKVLVEVLHRQGNSALTFEQAAKKAPGGVSSPPSGQAALVVNKIHGHHASALFSLLSLCIYPPSGKDRNQVWNWMSTLSLSLREPFQQGVRSVFPCHHPRLEHYLLSLIYASVRCGHCCFVYLPDRIINLSYHLSQLCAGSCLRTATGNGSWGGRARLSRGRARLPNHWTHVKKRIMK